MTRTLLPLASNDQELASEMIRRVSLMSTELFLSASSIVLAQRVFDLYINAWRFHLMNVGGKLNMTSLTAVFDVQGSGS